MGEAIAADRIVYRAGRLDDVPRFVELIAGANLPPLFIAEFIDGFVAAEQDGEVVACGGVEMYHDCAVIRSVVVDERARGLGLGGAIAGRLESNARDAGATEIYLLTADALRFWQRRGYVETPFEEWAMPPRICWQYQFVSQNADLVGIAHPMRRDA